MSEKKLWGLGCLLSGLAAGALNSIDWRYGMACVCLAAAMVCFIRSINKMVDRQIRE